MFELGPLWLISILLKNVFSLAGNRTLLYMVLVTLEGSNK